MDNSKTPKIVIGAGLAAVYSGLAFYFLRDAPGGSIAPDAATVSAPQAVGASAPLPAIVPSSADTSAGLAEQPVAVTEAPSSAARATASSLGASARRAEPVEPGGQGEEQAVATEQPVASADADSVSPAADAPLSAPAEIAVPGNDSQITADVRTQIAAVAPASTIDVTTTDGAVELSGSVPSAEEIDRVSQAARTVPNVRSVDASALMVGN